MQDKLEILNQRFRYKSDTNGTDSWRILDLDKTTEGDCEDYSLTALYYLCDKSLLKFWWRLITFKSSIHYVILGGAGHAVLEHDNMFIDNTMKKWMNRNQFDNRFVQIRKFMPWHVARRLLMGKFTKA